MTRSKTIVITGVSKGLGLALVEGFIEAGHQVLGCARSPEKISELNSMYQTKQSQFSVVDVASWQEVKSWCDKLLGLHGPPDLLINNAAIINENDVLWNVDPADFSNLIDVNIKGIYHTIRALVPSMVTKKSGVIVNISSGWGRSTSPEVAPYCATKFAVEGLTQALAHELPRNMAAIPLNPGIIHTELLEICFKGMASSYPDPKHWAQSAVPYILDLDASDNGKSLTVPY